MRPADVRSLFAYNEWANSRILSAAALLDPGVFTELREVKSDLIVFKRENG